MENTRPPQNLNEVLLEGNLLEDPKFRETGKGLYCNFDLAVENWEGFDTLHVGVKARNAIARICRDNLVKGSRILIKGRLVPSSWENAHGSHKRVEVLILHLKCLDIKGVR